MLTPEQSSAINKIVNQITTGKVIPIVGYDLLFNEFDKTTGYDFLKRIIKLHAKDEDIEKKLNGARTGNELINAFYSKLNYDEKNYFKVDVSRTIQENRLNLKLVPESFRKLVSIKYFKLFINATFTNTLELALNTYRAEGHNEQEIKSSYVVKNYHPNNPEPFPESAPERFFINLSKPHIYNLFGTHDSLDHEYVLTDADYIELIYDLISKKTKFENILSYLKGAYLLFLGCNFPDWFFRLFIRICVGDKLDLTPFVKLKAVSDSLYAFDPSRTFFIDQYGIQKLDIDSNLLVNEIYKAFLRQPETPNLTNKVNNKVFISYCRKDEQIARDIAEQLDSKYIEYFLDIEQLRTGDKLPKIIYDEIDSACLFLPIVSNNLQSATDYFCFEWAYALHKEKPIWPIYKDFVNQNMPLPCGADKLAEIRNEILNKYDTLGIKVDDANTIPEAKLDEIKHKQYLSRVSGTKELINLNQ